MKWALVAHTVAMFLLLTIPVMISLKGRAFVFYHHHLVEFPRSDPLAFGGAVAVRSQAASPRGPGHP